MNHAGMSNSPSARRLDATDEQLGAELKQQWTGASPAPYPVGELLDRHWEAAFAYARLCTDGERAAGMLTTAAFTRLFGATLRQDGPTAAWRPHLLVTIRRLAAEWDADGPRDLLHPELRSHHGDGERVAARLLPPANRRMLSRAFQRLPQSARCLLWHTEVETEPLATPAALLGLDDDGARVELRRARARLREEVLQVHNELATDEECHRYHRLLDVTCRRGGVDLDADLRAHTERCRHCAHTADQLLQFEGLLGVALAEGVLGWAAHAYLAARAAAAETAEAFVAEATAAPGEPFTDETGLPTGPAAPLPTAPARPARAARGSRTAPATTSGVSRSAARSAAGPAGDAPAGSRRSVQKAVRRARRRHLAAAVLTVSGLVVLPLVLWATLGSGEGSGHTDGQADGRSDTQAGGRGDGKAATSPGAGTGSTSSDPSWIGAQDPQGTLRGGLRNVSSGLCIGIAGDRAVEGAEAELATCSSALGQQWSYETDGLLRSTADTGLCLDSRLGYSVRLAPCTGGARTDTRDLRYDFTLQGTLVPRSGQDLALAPAATDGSGALVLKNREDGPEQRWVIDTSQSDARMQLVNWGETGSPGVTPAPTAGTATPAPQPSSTPSASAPTTTPSATDGTGCSYGDHHGCEDDDRGGYGDGRGRHGDGRD